MYMMNLLGMPSSFNSLLHGLFAEYTILDACFIIKCFIKVTLLSLSYLLFASTNFFAFTQECLFWFSLLRLCRHFIIEE